jgi:hypothetical protein
MEPATEKGNNVRMLYDIQGGGKELKNLPQTATKNNTKTAHNLSNPFALLIVSGFDLLYTLVEFFLK